MMTTLTICWNLLFGVCVISDEYIFMTPYLHQHPGHFECQMAKRLWIEKFSDNGIEPDLITCKKS